MQAHVQRLVAFAQGNQRKRRSSWMLPPLTCSATTDMTVWPSGLRRWLKAPFRKGVGSNLTAVKWRAAQRTATLRRSLR